LLSVLALELDGPVIRCAVVTRKSLKKFELAHCETIDRTEDENEPISRDELAMIMAKITNCPQQIVVVTPRVVLIRVPVEKKLVKSLRFKPHKLKELLQAESEMYTGIPAEESLIGFEHGSDADAEHEGFWVSSFPAADYQQWKELLAESELRLKRVYPPDVCFTAPVSLLAGGQPKEKQLVIDVGTEAVRFALIHRGRMVSYRTVPVSLEQLKAELTTCSVWAELAYGEPFDVEAAAASVTITGAGGLEEDILCFLRASFNAEVSSLIIPTGNIVTAAKRGPEYATVVGAGLRELWYPYVKSRALGVSDELSLFRQLAEKAYFAPIVILLLFFLIFGVHFLIIRRQIKVTDGELTVLVRQRDSITAAATRLQELENKADELKEEKLLLYSQVEYLQNRLPEYNQLLYATLSALEQGAQPGLKYFTIELEEKTDYFTLSGESRNTSAIHALALALQDEEWCIYAKVDEILRIVRVEKSIDSDFDDFGYDFGDDFGDDFGYDDNGAGGTAPEAGLAPGAELFGDDESGFDDFGDDTASQLKTVIVYQFKIRVVLKPEFLPERPFEVEGDELELELEL